ncbi:hypothetical protein [Sorangium sp. So ce385]|uniref:hypothetical protein n=1 Tax=Sorangium sp. So ce385 TaxID=3133308 RepID=UPI003F5B014D
MTNRAKGYQVVKVGATAPLLRTQRDEPVGDRALPWFAAQGARPGRPSESGEDAAGGLLSWSAFALAPYRES